MLRFLEAIPYTPASPSRIGIRKARNEKTRSDEESEAYRLKRAVREATYLSGVFVEEDALPSKLHKWVDLQGHVRAMKNTAKDFDSAPSVAPPTPPQVYLNRQILWTS
ncbi:hypothetical protein K1719_032803 [Acacia pycnantha]|nr:hypothetical protein K1719_032803 [Acacia pycnantha]